MGQDSVVLLAYKEGAPKFGVEDLEPLGYSVVLVTKTGRSATLRANINVTSQRILELDAFDADGLAELTRGFTEVYGFDRVKLITSDESCVLDVARARKMCGLSIEGDEKYLRFIDKRAMKQKVKAANLRVPRYVQLDKSRVCLNRDVYLDSIVHQLGFPIIGKPVNKAGSYGVKRINDNAALHHWMDHILRDDLEYEMDECIVGELYHCESIVIEGKPIYTCVSVYNTTWEQFARGMTVGSILLRTEDPIREVLLKYNSRIIEIMRPPEGVTHLEVFVTNKRECVFLEIAARPPGIFHVPVHEMNTGINLEKAHMYAQLGLKPSVEERRGDKCFAGAMLPKIEGRVSRLRKPKTNSRVDINWAVSVGDVLERSESIATSDEIAGQMLMQNEDYQELKNDFFLIHEFDYIVTEDS